VIWFISHNPASGATESAGRRRDGKADETR